MPAERLAKPRYLPTFVAEGLSNFSGILPEPIRKPFIEMADKLPFAPETASTIAKKQTWGYLHDVLVSAEKSSDQLPSKEYQWLAARAELYHQSRISQMILSNTFPDRPGIKEWFAPFKNDFLNRLINAYTTYRHPANGLPDIWISQDGQTCKLHLEQGLDGTLLYDMYDTLPNQQEAYFEMEKIFDEAVRSEIPAMAPDVLNRLRFLGMSDEEEFIRITEENLLNRINAKIGEVTGVNERTNNFNLRRLADFMEMAKLSDLIRINEDPQNGGKRRTGESYYCHYLASAWLLWTMLEEDLQTPQEVSEALEDMETMMVHDLMEDLPYRIRTQFNHERKENSFYLEMDIPQNGETAPRTLSVELTRNQWLILEAMHKGKDDESGFIWLEKIKNIYDPNDPTPQRKNYLMKKAARCKAADRLANLLTITAAGGPFYDVARKLNESIYAGRYLLWLANFADLGPIGTMDRLKKIARNNRFVLLLSSIPLMAEMEKRNIMIKFGQVLLEKIKGRQDLPWAKHIAEVLDQQIRHPHKGTEPLPYGFRRLENFIACYKIKPELFDYIIPAERLHHFLSLEEFVTQENFFPPNQPIEFNHFTHLIKRLQRFEQWMIPYRGILPGGVDDHFGPNWLAFHLEDLFMEEMAETIAWGKAFEYEEK